MATIVKRRKTPGARRAGVPAERDLPAAAARDEPALMALARQLQSWTTSALGMAGAATDVTMNLAKAGLKRPGQRATIEKAGALLHDLRQTAGLSVQELGSAIGLNDASALELIERGKVAMPFELILRAAAVLGRNDPLTFVMQLTRAYNPALWKTLEDLGVGRLLVQGGREREFANIYRAHDAARELSDEQFARAVAFMNAAFELALAFVQPERPSARARKAPPAR
jgi:transcriptional regulator with XRE-family HTH domain